MAKKIIYEKLMEFGGGVHRKGFEYVVSAINTYINKPNIPTMELYDNIALENNDTCSRVERAIRYFIEKLMVEGNQDKIMELHLRNNSPTSTEFLRAFALYIKLND